MASRISRSSRRSCASLGRTMVKRTTGKAAPARMTRIDDAMMSSSRVIPTQEDFWRLAIALIGDTPPGKKEDIGPECHEWIWPRERQDPSTETGSLAGLHYKTWTFRCS